MRRAKRRPVASAPGAARRPGLGDPPQRPRKAHYPVVDALARHTAIAQHHRRLRGAGGVGQVMRLPQHDALVAGGLGQARHRHLAIEPRIHMQARPRLRQLHRIADARRDCIAQHDLALRVLGAHALDVVREMAVRHEIRQRRLQVQLPRPIDAGAGARERFGHLRRHHHVAHAQAREHGLAEGAHVDHPAVGVQALQRRDRRAVVAELAVVVVLEHPQAARPRRLQQLQAPRQR
ncbi:hypothetical protein, partial [Achromobacter insuavis]|uniref:hypothetical protein n=1 Tax=Achromobacter insuavis TaxID=1287735 RepID=UPI0035A1D2A2